MLNTRFEIATFAGGCFWCMVSPFDGLEGIMEVKSGYTGGHTEDPAYREVCSGTTGHYEAIQIKYDPARITYKELLELFWKQIDPTDEGGQFYDRGSQYQTAIFYHNQEQKSQAEESKKQLEASGRFNKVITTEILPASRFYNAEEYHQDYHKKNPEHYKAYRTGSGRAGFLEKHWNDTSEMR